MSLVNQMLKDLQNRNKAPVAPEIALSGLFPTDRPISEESRIIKVILLLTVAVFVLLSILTINKLFYSSKESNKGILVSTTNEIVTSPIVDDSELSALPEAELTSSTLKSIGLHVQEHITYLQFNLNKVTRYSVEAFPAQNKLMLVLEHTTINPELPAIDYLQSAIEGLEMTNDEEGNLIISMILPKGAEINRLEMSTANKTPELHLSIATLSKKQLHSAAKVIQELQTQPSFSMSQTAGFNQQQQLQNAINFSDQGKKDKAVSLLTALLKDDPNYFPARQSLVEILLHQNDALQANAVLQQGLLKQPNFPPLIEMKARLLVTEGKSRQALSLLERLAPSIETYPEYHAFIAALYQQNGQSLLARKLYERLVKQHPDKAVWWLGLGIALENLGNLSEAKNVYLHASRLDGLNPETSAFLQTRINSI